MQTSIRILIQSIALTVGLTAIPHAAPDDGTVGPPPACGTLIFGPSLSGTWTAAGSPYCVLADVQINGLTIEPGVEVLVEGPFTLTVAGVLNAVGTAADPIRFRSKDPDSGQRWKGLLFQSSLPGSVLEHCIVEYSDMSGMRILNSHPTIRDCVVRRNSTTLDGGGIFADLSSGDLTLVRTTITDNESRFSGAGMRAILSTGKLDLIDCALSRNFANPGAANGSYVGGGLWASGETNLTGCTISNNTVWARAETFADRTAQGGGAYVDSGPLTVRASYFGFNSATCFSGGSLNTRRGRGGGLSVFAQPTTVFNTIFGGNFVNAASERSGAALYLYAGSPGTLENVTVARNALQITASAIHLHEATTIRNSIIYFNNRTSVSPETYGDQLGGSVVPTIEYSNVQGDPVPSPTNIAVNPLLGPATFLDVESEPCDLVIDPNFSPCVDAGDPAPPFDDGCIPSGAGTARNDMGAHGGPGNCGVASLDGVGSSGSVSRNGSGANPDVFTEVCPAVIGQPWTTFVDETTPGAQASAVSISINGPLAGVPLAIGELLCIPPFLNGFTTTVVGGNHGFTMPFVPSLVGKRFCAQAALIFLPPVSIQLTNAIDVRIGSY